MTEQYRRVKVINRKTGERNRKKEEEIEHNNRLIKRAENIERKMISIWGPEGSKSIQSKRAGRVPRVFRHGEKAARIKNLRNTPQPPDQAAKDMEGYARGGMARKRCI